MCDLMANHNLFTSSLMDHMQNSILFDLKNDQSSFNIINRHSVEFLMASMEFMVSGLKI